jgi:hypothetical protein
MEFYGLPPIGQKQKRPARSRGLPGAQTGHSFIPRGSVKPVGTRKFTAIQPHWELWGVGGYLDLCNGLAHL